MADNFDFTPGTGKTGSADDVDGVLYPRVKLDFGTDGVTAPALAGAGVVATGVQRVTLASDDPAVVDLAAIEVLLGTIDTDTGVIAGDTTSIDGKVTACNTGAVVLATGSAAIGKLAANSGVDIGDVDILSIAAGDNNIGNVDIVTVPAPLSVVGGGTEAAALRVTLANDSTGVITVDGTVTANAGTNLNTSALALEAGGNLATIAGDTTSLDTKVTACNTGAVVLSSGTVTTVSTVTTLSQLGGQAISMGEGVVAAGCQRVTLATDDDGVAHLATIAGDTTNIETAIQIIDDWDATHAGAAVADGPQIMGAAYSTALPTDVGADADAARLVTDRYGRLCTGLQPQAAKAVLDNADVTTAREVVAKVASRKIYVTSLMISVDTAGNYWLEDEDGTAVTSKKYFAANGGCAQTYPEGTPLNTVTVNKGLFVKGSVSGNVGVDVTYYLAV